MEQEFLSNERENTDEVISLSRNKIMELMTQAWNECDVNQEAAFKENFISNSMDGSEDHLVSQHIMDMVGEEFKAFRAELRASNPANDMRELLSSITNPEGVRRSDQPNDFLYIDKTSDENDFEVCKICHFYLWLICSAELIKSTSEPSTR